MGRCRRSPPGGELSATGAGSTGREAEREGRGERAEKGREGESLGWRGKGQDQRTKGKRRNGCTPHTPHLTPHTKCKTKLTEENLWKLEFGKQLRYVPQSAIHKRTN